MRSANWILGVCAVAVLHLLVDDRALSQDAARTRLLDPSALSDFVKKHKGPILDVRLQGDCDENLSLRSTTASIGFDFGPDNPEGKKMAQDMFMSRVNSTSPLVAAKKSKSTVLVVCCAGGRSEAAANLLAKNGFKVVHVPGGMQGEKIPKHLLKLK